MKINKKIALALSVVLVLTAMLAGFTAFANNDITYDFNSDTATLTINGNGDMQDYTQDNYKQSPWYDKKDEIKHIVISNGITKIGDFSFCFESQLEDVVLPDGLKSIGTAAFAGNDKLLSLSIPESVEEIGTNSFGFNSQMKLTPNFTAVCAINSYAQQYCISNYIAFDTPFSETNSDKAVITKANAQCMWSFVAKTDGVITFYSTGTRDTFALIYDASNYVYSQSFDIMKKSAVVSGDDNGDDLNFKISCPVKSGERYYLAAKYKNPSISSGSFDVHITFECTSHIYQKNVLVEPTCDTDGSAEFTCIACGHSYQSKLYALGHDYSLVDFKNGMAKIKCSRCNDEYSIAFIDYVNSHNPILDVVEDGVINAKDYAQLKKTFNN